MLLNYSSFVFIHLIYYVKIDLFSVKNTFVFKKMFVPYLIFLRFHSFELLCKNLPLFS